MYITCVCRWPQRPGKGIQFPGAGVTGGFEPHNMGPQIKLSSHTEAASALNQ